MNLYRSARATSPHLGRMSFWTTRVEHARSFSAWEARALPQRGPSCIYTTTVTRDERVFDARTSYIIGQVFASGNHRELRDEIAEHMTADGYRWVHIFEGPINGSMWTVAIYLGDTPRAAPISHELGSPSLVREAVASLIGR